MTGKPLDLTPIDQLKGVGPKLKATLAQLGIESVQDLLFHLPYRYEDRTRITPIGKAVFGDCIQVQGEIVDNGVQFGRRRSLRCLVSDNTGFIGLRFYHFSSFQQSRLAVGKLIRCYGEVRHGRGGFEMYHPEYRILREPGDPLPDSLTPVYPRGGRAASRPNPRSRGAGAGNARGRGAVAGTAAGRASCATLAALISPNRCACCTNRRQTCNWTGRDAAKTARRAGGWRLRNCLPTGFACAA